MTFERQIDLAARLIKKYGGPVVLHVTTNVPVAGKPWDTSAPQADEQLIPTSGVFLTFSRLQYGQTFANGDVIHASDRRMLVAAKGMAFKPNLKGYVVRTLTDGSTENWSIEGIDPLEPNGEQIMYSMQVRQ